MNNLNFLIIDDDENIRYALVTFLSQFECTIFEAGSTDEALECIRKEMIDVVIADFILPGISGFDLIKKLKSFNSKIEIIVMSGSYETIDIKKLFDLGAIDFFKKPFNLNELEHAIRRTQRYLELSRKNSEIYNHNSILSDELRHNIGEIIGRSEAIQNVVKLALKAGENPETPVLITGPSGSGKELIAKVIHYGGISSKGPFYIINSAALPESLIESELFGHKKGTFTGAVNDKKGALLIADKGTIFLDEIGDMPFEFQSKLLRVIENRKFRPLGSETEEKSNFRLICATNCDIEDKVKNNEFRLDLFHRINTIHIKLPSLKERATDIPPLIDYYVNHYSRQTNKTISYIHPDVYGLLMNYSFPGNIRELKNMIERAVIFSENRTILPSAFQLVSDKLYREEYSGMLPTLKLEELTKIAIKEALKKSEGNKSKASRLLNISWFSLDRRLKKYNID